MNKRRLLTAVCILAVALLVLPVFFTQLFWLAYVSATITSLLNFLFENTFTHPSLGVICADVLVVVVLLLVVRVFIVRHREALEQDYYR